MNRMLIQRSMPALRDQPPARQHCARDSRRQCELTADTQRTAFIDAFGVTGTGLGGTLTTSIALPIRLAHLESP
jgi:hypothetical protein